MAQPSIVDSGTGTNIGIPKINSASSLKLDIAIVGAGIASLSAAIPLAQKGHYITVYESAPELSEIGAGVQMTPNAIRLWYSWGLGPDLLKNAALPTGLNVRRWRDGEMLSYTGLTPDFEQKFGAPYFVIHRAHIHGVLYEHALKAGVRVQVGCRVIDYDYDAPCVTLAQGERIQADLVVAVDGINSFARSHFMGSEASGPRRVSTAAYRLIVEVEDLKADPTTAWIVSSPNLDIW
ncbi:hypothetical protein VTN00DRAFT_8505 [Thermoascus crustaceus]|uniref:uncharacterized protein n=1 Tax=Thermoascus crustaceus TaxID=5088 RepID=UPI00374469E3